MNAIDHPPKDRERDLFALIEDTTASSAASMWVTTLAQPGEPPHSRASRHRAVTTCVYHACSPCNRTTVSRRYCGLMSNGSGALPTFGYTAGYSLTKCFRLQFLEKTLCHNPDNDIGITGTDVRSSMRFTPERNSPISPSFVNCPSGKIQTSCPSANACSTSS